ncbi:MAG: PLP-dependent aspartate aminotransferase family protein [Bacteroidales bacterium]|nr:PLP-dependent aspartate aminotransferase family protein [Bacteroidales bacterium]MDD4671689.1 PLP-dependent aspartate aminotransferase family protein [Bacteroidales bacterium]MDY0349528.1 PLP-dependent aspartate aminotransferase family protein [Tenuifilaceae bacterium]
MALEKMGFNSKLIHAGADKDQFGSATVPIYQSSTFGFKSADDAAKCFLGEKDGFIYTRVSNPTIQALERQIAILEGGFGGIATSSGMGAVSTIYMSLLKQGDHMISTSAVYGSSRVVMESYFSKFGVESTYITTSNIENIKKAIKPNTKVLYIETPSNPTMEVTDIEACVALAREHNIITVIDNTFCSPYLQRPLEYGADIVLNSMTKFINGHADVVAGMIVARNEELYTALHATMINMGCNMDPHQAYLVLRGVKTLAIRIERAQQNAMKIAKHLESHPKVEWVKYPGLKSHPQYELAKKQMSGPGTMICFELKSGFNAGKTLMNNVKLAMLAVSLGGIETLIQHPASMTHSNLSVEAKEKANITQGLVRIAVGIEDVEDIIADLDQALAMV